MATTKVRVVVWLGMMLVIGCIFSNGSDVNKSELATTTYAFVGRPQFTSTPYRDQSTLQTTTDRAVKIGIKKWRDDFQCGPEFPLEDGNPAECDPDSIYPCCSPGNWCGNTTHHCDCEDCVFYKKAGCPSGYTQYGGTFFKVYNQAKTYDQARHVCAADGGLLAMPKDRDLDILLWKLKKAADPGVHFWFGLSDRKREGEWMWADGTPHNVTTDWGGWNWGQPDDNAGGEDCVHYRRYCRTWNDMQCKTSLKFICQLTQVLRC
ncbi:lactose-binding lectin l-2-like [Branchiostoma lanceolatum]|uniref:lactose-binding lectin l-2-like n=1 Tax=Branchiostoma lanceolatum TaxID=7740 RepID=UPI003453228D